MLARENTKADKQCHAHARIHIAKSRLDLCRAYFTASGLIRITYCTLSLYLLCNMHFDLQGDNLIHEAPQCSRRHIDRALASMRSTSLTPCTRYLCAKKVTLVQRTSNSASLDFHVLPSLSSPLALPGLARCISPRSILQFNHTQTGYLPVPNARMEVDSL